MSWVCSHVQQDGWLCPVAKPASVSQSCLVPWECVGKARGATVERREAGGGGMVATSPLCSLRALLGGAAWCCYFMENLWYLRKGVTALV